MQVIYIDTLFFINLIVNYLILLATAKVCAHTISRCRIALGALVGAIYSMLTVLPSLRFLGNAIMMIVFAIIMLLIVFGGKQGLIRTGVIFFAISAAFGGAVLAVSLITGEKARITVPFKVLLISFFICYGIFSIVFSRLGKREAAGGTVKIGLTKGEKRVEFTALVDSGNSLVDPMTGGKVIVAELEPLMPLFTDDIRNILKKDDSPMECLEELAPFGSGYGFFLLPYTAVGVGSSFLLGFRPDEVSVGGKVLKKISVAISPTRVSDGGIYSALVNGGV